MREVRKMTFAFDYPTKRGPRRWLRKVLIVIGVVGVLYAVAFELMYFRRRPAGNMVYFIYSDNDTIDTFSYHFFYPAYWVQRRLFRFGQTHNEDREPIVFPSGFEG